MGAEHRNPLELALACSIICYGATVQTTSQAYQYFFQGFEVQNLRLRQNMKSRNCHISTLMSKVVSVLPAETNTALFLLLISNRMSPEWNKKLVNLFLMANSANCFGGANQIHDLPLDHTWIQIAKYSNLPEKNKHTCLQDHSVGYHTQLLEYSRKSTLQTVHLSCRMCSLFASQISLNITHPLAQNKILLELAEVLL